MAPGEGRLYVDGTFGGGGHTRALLEAGASVIGLDRDLEAIEHGRNRLTEHAHRLELVQADFRTMTEILAERGVLEVDGILLDLGVSSHQLESPERGFSFLEEGPLDMRMDPARPVTAADLVNSLSDKELEQIFHRFGEEPAARRIARKILEVRGRGPIRKTTELAELVEEAVPRHGKRHPATRIFQALRIAVNDELGALQDALEQSDSLLRPGGRLAVISFHSLEDRMIKRFMKARSVEWLDRPEWPAPKKNPRRTFRVLTKRPVTPDEREIRRNPRARSAKLRVAERI